MTKTYFQVADMKVIFGQMYIRKNKNCLLEAVTDALGT